MSEIRRALAIFSLVVFTLSGCGDDPALHAHIAAYTACVNAIRDSMRAPSSREAITPFDNGFVRVSIDSSIDELILVRGANSLEGKTEVTYSCTAKDAGSGVWHVQKLKVVASEKL